MRQLLYSWDDCRAPVSTLLCFSAAIAFLFLLWAFSGVQKFTNILYDPHIHLGNTIKPGKATKKTMTRFKTSPGEIMAISLVCLFAVSPLFMFMCLFVFPKFCCYLRKRRMGRAPGEGARLLASESDSGYVADNEASSSRGLSYGSTSTLGSSDDSERGYWTNADESRPSHFTITWDPYLSWTVRPSRRRLDSVTI